MGDQVEELLATFERPGAGAEEQAGGGTAEPTTAGILAAWERLERHTVRIFCHPDDADRVMAACGPLDWPYRVTPSLFVPAGQLYVFDPSASTTEQHTGGGDG